jgi:hypothetical protein
MFPVTQPGAILRVASDGPDVPRLPALVLQVWQRKTRHLLSSLPACSDSVHTVMNLPVPRALELSGLWVCSRRCRLPRRSGQYQVVGANQVVSRESLVTVP